MTLGLALRFGDYPPAVMLPSAPVMADRRAAVIEAQPIHESAAISTGNSLSDGRLRRGMQSNQFFRNEPLTYTAQGTSDVPSEGNGFLIDLYI